MSPRQFFWVFLLTLPGCYFTTVPAILCAVVLVLLTAEEKWFQWETNTDLAEIRKEMAEMRQELNGLNLRAGLGIRK
jgi:hypothetical protein